MAGRVQRFADETTVHAIKEYYYGNVFGKIFWGFLVLASIVCLSLQLREVLQKFSEEETGATLTQYHPPEMPAVTFCPDGWVDEEKAAKYNLTGKSVSVINGFMSLAGIYALFSYGANHNLLKEETIMLVGNAYAEEYRRILPLWNDLGKNIEDVVEAIALKEPFEIHWAEIDPLGVELDKPSRVITLSGVCYKLETDVKVNSFQSDFAGIKIHLTPKPTLRSDIAISREPDFRLLLGSVGGVDLMGIDARYRFLHGGHYLVLYKLVKRTTINTRKWPCRNMEYGDLTHCVFAHANVEAKGKGGFIVPDGCETPLPKTKINVASKTTNPCNTFVDVLGSSIVGLIKLNYSDFMWNTLCPRPCSHTTYEYTMQVEGTFVDAEGKQENRTVIEIKAAGGLSGMEIREYLIVNLVDMMSNIGGTMGLYIGASVLSFFQAIYYLCLEKPFEKRSRRNNGIRDEKPPIDNDSK